MLEGCPSGVGWLPRGSREGLSAPDQGPRLRPAQPMRTRWPQLQEGDSPHPPLPGRPVRSTPGQAAVTGTKGDFPVGTQRDSSLSWAVHAPCPSAEVSPLPIGPPLLTMGFSGSGPPSLPPVGLGHGPGVLRWGVPLRSRSCSKPGQQGFPGRQADEAFEVGSSEQRGEGAAGRPQDPSPAPSLSPPLSNHFFN